MWDFMPDNGGSLVVLALPVALLLVLAVGLAASKIISKILGTKGRNLC